MAQTRSLCPEVRRPSVLGELERPSCGDAVCWCGSFPGQGVRPLSSRCRSGRDKVGYCPVDQKKICELNYWVVRFFGISIIRCIFLVFNKRNDDYKLRKKKLLYCEY